MHHLRNAILIPAALFAVPAQAATIGAASIDYAAELPSFDDILVDFEPGLSDMREESTGAATATARADAGPTAGAVSATSDARGGGTAEASANTVSGFAVENLRADAVDVSFDLTYRIMAEALSGDEETSAVATLSVLDDFGMLFERRLAFDSADPGSDVLTGTETISLDLSGFDFNFIEFRASVETAATAMRSPTPIPLPAAGWMLIAAFGGLAGLRRSRVG